MDYESKMSFKKKNQEPKGRNLHFISFGFIMASSILKNYFVIQVRELCYFQVFTPVGDKMFVW